MAGKRLKSILGFLLDSLHALLGTHAANEVGGLRVLMAVDGEQLLF